MPETGRPDASTDAGTRFLTLSDVAKVLHVSNGQAYALVRSGDLPAIKVGGRGQWRIEATQLQRFVEKAYRDTADFITAHPFGSRDPAADDKNLR